MTIIIGNVTLICCESSQKIVDVNKFQIENHKKQTF